MRAASCCSVEVVKGGAGVRRVGFVTTEVTALVNGAEPKGLNTIQQSAADAIVELTGVVGAVQDAISGEAKSDLFVNLQKVVTGQMTAAQAVESAVRLNGT